MRLAISVLAGTLAFGVQEVRADFAALYLQAHGGYGGGDTEELMPGGDDPALGPALGLQAGARLFMLEAYLDRTEMLRTGAVTRAVLGLHGEIEVLHTRFMLRAGVGGLSEEDGALTGVEDGGTQRLGALARLGAAVDRELVSGLYLGIGLDGEAYALEDERTGFDVMANLRLTFELGI